MASHFPIGKTLLISITILIVTVLDFYVPLGVAMAVLYTIPILLTYSIGGNTSTLWAGLTCFVLTILGLYLSGDGGELWKVLSNRGISLLMIGVSAWFVIAYKRIDQTLQTRNQELLESNDRMYMEALSATAETMALSTVDTGKFIYLNKEFTEVYGFTEEEAIGKTANELGMWPDKSERPKFIDLIREGGKVINYETALRGKSGELIPMFTSGSIIKYKGIDCLFISSRGQKSGVGQRRNA